VSSCSALREVVLVAQSIAFVAAFNHERLNNSVLRISRELLQSALPCLHDGDDSEATPDFHVIPSRLLGSLGNSFWP